jgi:group I intron endonuclease
MVIYITTNLITGEKYIGKDSHNNPKYLGSGVVLKENIKLYGRKNFKKEILEYCDTNEDLHIRESYWIKEYNAIQSDDFYNIVDYSAGWNLDKLGPKKYQQVIDKIQSKTQGIPRPYLKDNIERKEKLRQANIGRSKPKGFGEKISRIKTGKSLSSYHIEKIRLGKLGKKQPQSFLEKKFKPIIQLDKENNTIQIFNSIEEAANSNPKFKRSNISCCLTGKSKTAYGYKWIYN